VRPLDVGDELTGFGRSQGEHWAGLKLNQEDRQTAFLTWGSMIARMRPADDGEPLQPEEIERAIEMLNAIVEAVVATRAASRGHLRIVAEQPEAKDD